MGDSKPLTLANLRKPVLHGAGLTNRLKALVYTCIVRGLLGLNVWNLLSNLTYKGIKCANSFHWSSCLLPLWLALLLQPLHFPMKTLPVPWAVRLKRRVTLPPSRRSPRAPAQCVLSSHPFRRNVPQCLLSGLKPVCPVNCVVSCSRPLLC